MLKRGVTVYIYFVSLHMYTYVYSIHTLHTLHTYIHMSNKGPKVKSYEIGDKIHLNIFLDLRYNTLQLYTIVR